MYIPKSRVIERDVIKKIRNLEIFHVIFLIVSQYIILLCYVLYINFIFTLFHKQNNSSSHRTLNL